MLTKYDITNLDCANCAAKIEKHPKKHPVVKDVILDFASLTLHINTDQIETIRTEIKKIEPAVNISLRNTNIKNDTIRSDNDKFNPKREIITISIAFLLFMVQLLFEQDLHRTPWGIAEYVVSLTAYFLAGWNVLSGALRTFRKGRIFDENVLMTIATIGAFAIHAISEAVSVMIFFKIGEFLQNLAVSRSRKSIKALLQIRPDCAIIKTERGTEKVSPENVKPGEIIIVKAGEKIPLDGVVLSGSSLVNTSALTGESVPATVRPGDSVLAGAINTTALLTISVTKVYSESSIAKILDLVENATAKKTKTERNQ